jgi:signal transduction histidine kinase
MRRFASDTFAAREIAFHFRAPDGETDIRLGANLRREVFLIFKESINNLVKHSGCSEADIEFQTAGDSLWLKVSDNGKGFDTSNNYDGHGLLSIRERAVGIGGQLDIVSKAGEGTRVTLRVKLPQPSASDGTATTGGDGKV